MLVLVPKLGDSDDAFFVLYYNTMPVLAIHGVLDLILDVFIFILPLPLILRLSMPLSKRLQLMGVFGTALM